MRHTHAALVTWHDWLWAGSVRFAAKPVRHSKGATAVPLPLRHVTVRCWDPVAPGVHTVEPEAVPPAGDAQVDHSPTDQDVRAFRHGKRLQGREVGGGTCCRWWWGRGGGPGCA